MFSKTSVGYGESCDGVAIPIDGVANSSRCFRTPTLGMATRAMGLAYPSVGFPTRADVSGHQRWAWRLVRWGCHTHRWGCQLVQMFPDSSDGHGNSCDGVAI